MVSRQGPLIGWLAALPMGSMDSKANKDEVHSEQLAAGAGRGCLESKSQRVCRG